jgi:hypothetical protein
MATLIGSSMGIVSSNSTPPVGTSGRCGPLTLAPYTVFDDFNRTVAPGWGTASSGPVWSNDAGTLSVNGSAGSIANLGGTSGIVHVTGGQWASASPFTMQVRFTLTSVPVYPATGALTFWFTDSTFQNYYYVGIDASGGTSSIAMDMVQSSVVVGANSSLVTWSNSTYLMKIYSDTSGYQTKVWLDGTTEPSSWLSVAHARNAALSASTLWFRITAATMPTLVDYIWFLI